MANNIQITQGSGTTLGTDDVGGVHYQKVKLEKGSAGKATSATKFAVISVSSAGDNTIVAAVASNVIRVISFLISSSGVVNVKWKSAATDKTGLIYLDTKGGAVGPYNPDGHFQTGVNEALILNLSAAVAVGGVLSYVEEA